MESNESEAGGKPLASRDNSQGESVGQRLIAARRELGMKQADVAELIHVSERSMQAYEADEVVPFRKLKELSEILDKPMAWILHGDRAETTPGDMGPYLQDILTELRKISGHLLEE